ncbi:hypothetical protein V8C37DRAFT_395709 [Trichoderma ceciliae]
METGLFKLSGQSRCTDKQAKHLSSSHSFRIFSAYPYRKQSMCVCIVIATSGCLCLCLGPRRHQNRHQIVRSTKRLFPSPASREPARWRPATPVRHDALAAEATITLTTVYRLVVSYAFRPLFIPGRKCAWPYQSCLVYTVSYPTKCRSRLPKDRLGFSRLSEVVRLKRGHGPRDAPKGEDQLPSIHRHLRFVSPSSPRNASQSLAAICALINIKWSGSLVDEFSRES